jgi:hypothetical protein
VHLKRFCLLAKLFVVPLAIGGTVQISRGQSPLTPLELQKARVSVTVGVGSVPLEVPLELGFFSDNVAGGAYHLRYRLSVDQYRSKILDSVIAKAPVEIPCQAEGSSSGEGTGFALEPENYQVSYGDKSALIIQVNAAFSQSLCASVQTPDCTTEYSYQQLPFGGKIGVPHVQCRPHLNKMRTLVSKTETSVPLKLVASGDAKPFQVLQTGAATGLNESASVSGRILFAQVAATIESSITIYADGVKSAQQKFVRLPSDAVVSSLTREFNIDANSIYLDILQSIKVSGQKTYDRVLIDDR